LPWVACLLPWVACLLHWVACLLHWGACLLHWGACLLHWGACVNGLRTFSWVFAYEVIARISRRKGVANIKARSKDFQLSTKKEQRTVQITGSTFMEDGERFEKLLTALRISRQRCKIPQTFTSCMKNPGGMMTRHWYQKIKCLLKSHCHVQFRLNLCPVLTSPECSGKKGDKMLGCYFDITDLFLFTLNIILNRRGNISHATPTSKSRCGTPHCLYI